jgi:hypothetical protein
MYRAEDLRKQIEKTAPDFYERIDFLNLWFEAQRLSHRVEKPNLDLLCKLWGRLGNYLHAQKEPKETVGKKDWWVKFDGLLLETRTELEKALKKDRGALRLNNRGMALYELFRTGKYTRQQIINMIRIDTVSPIKRLH